jgi:hypothetical protein
MYWRSPQSFARFSPAILIKFQSILIGNKFHERSFACGLAIFEHREFLENMYVFFVNNDVTNFNGYNITVLKHTFDPEQTQNDMLAEIPGILSDNIIIITKILSNQCKYCQGKIWNIN